MSTSSLNISASQTGTAYTSDLNAALLAINSCHSGNTAPITEIVSGKFWLDTSGTNPVLKIYRNGWKSLFTLNATSVDMSINVVAAANVTATSTVSAANVTATSTVSAANVTASNNVTATGTVSAANVNASNNITATNTVTAANVNTTSDIRLKTKVKTLENSLEKVLQLRGVSYTMNNETKIGVIAQEVQGVVPEVVTKGSDGYLSVAYGNLVGELIEAIKTQQSQIEELKERLTQNGL
jgi:hypothetical protein